MSIDPIDLLRLADPARPAITPIRRAPQRLGKRLSLLGGAGLVAALVVGTSAATVTAQTLLTSPPDHTAALNIHQPAAGGDELRMAVNDPAITIWINRYTAQYPIPPGTTVAEVFAPVLQTFPLAAGEDFADVVQAHPDWAGYFWSLHYAPTDIALAEDGDVARISEAGLSGTIALAATNAWYRYWLQATPAQQRKAQATLDTMQTWSDLTYRLGCQDATSCPGRVVEVARIAQAAADGNPEPMRAWLKNFNK